MTEPIWLEPPALIALHESTLLRHGGSSGIRSQEMLESALARPQNKYHYGETDLFVLAAAYGFGIARNHPFVDGNKRTVFLAATVFLGNNGYMLEVDFGEAIVAMLDLAAGKLGEAEFGVWLRLSCEQITD